MSCFFGAFDCFLILAWSCFQGHVRVGPDVVKDPAFLVTRNLEDFVTWVDTSKIRKHLMEYKELRDDFDMFC